MDENEVTLAVAAWCQETIPELQAATHFLTAEKGKLPDVAVDVAEKSLATVDPRFPRLSEMQQVAIRIFDIDLAFMVESSAGTDPEADRNETEQLRSMGARLEVSLLTDVTLGDRVPEASPLFSINYRLPFVQYADGTRGRQMTMALTVAEPITGDPAR